MFDPVLQKLNEEIDEALELAEEKIRDSVERTAKEYCKEVIGVGEMTYKKAIELTDKCDDCVDWNDDGSIELSGKYTVDQLRAFIYLSFWSDGD